MTVADSNSTAQPLNPPPSAEPESPPAAPSASVPLTPMQELMLAEAWSGSRTGTDILQILAYLPEEVSPSALEEAWKRVVARHDALRSRVVAGPRGAPGVEYPDDFVLPWEVEDLEPLGPVDRDTALESRLAADRERGFAWSDFPWMRVRLLRRSSTDWVMAWTVHHLLVDGASLPIVLRDVLETCRAIRSGAASMPAPVAAGSYRDFALRAHANARGPESGAAHWTRLLSGVPQVTPGPVPGGDAPCRTDELGSPVRRRLPREQGDRLAAWARSRGVTPPALIHGAWALLLAAATGQADVIFGTSREGRLRALGCTPDLDRVGCFVNTLPMRVRLPGEARVDDWLRDIHAQWLASGRHPLTPWTTLARASPLGPGTRLYQSFVVVHRASVDRQLRGRGGEWANRRFEVRRRSSIPWRLEVILDDPWEVHLTHPLGAAGAPLAEALLEDYLVLLDALTEGPDVALAEVLALARTRRDSRRLPASSARPTGCPTPGQATPEASAAHTLEGADRQGLATTPEAERGPRSALEAELHAIWSGLLGRSDFGVTDDFQSLGGHSLLAVRMLFELRARYGEHVSITLVRECPSIAALARRLERPSEAAFLALRGRGDRPPVFFVPGVPGVTYLPEAVLSRVGEVCPYSDGLQDPGVDGTTPPLDTVEGLARSLIEQVERVWPQGPLRVGGYSLGGMVAFEMARQWDRRGRRPELVLLLDTYLPGALRRRSLIEAGRSLGSFMRRIGFRASLRFLGTRFLEFARARRQRIQRDLGLDPGRDPARPATASEEARARLFEASFRAAHTLQREPVYDGPVLLLRARHREVSFGIFRDLDPRNGWSELVRGPLLLDDLAADHWSLVDPAVAPELGERLAHWLGKPAPRTLSDPGTNPTFPPHPAPMLEQA